ncbi:hypothetical protein HPG69_007263 [Diceros bicornis minor]|uniref:Uncharacterized protein n=1 Tax=Diceros bicornis minor TaxID=77932 RepID=A0A7J7FN46_DICBM|nr:hypothetical protein HPG69_007263 [Diceros bicornis minor]
MGMDLASFVTSCRFHVSGKPFTSGVGGKDFLPTSGLLEHQDTPNKYPALPLNNYIIIINGFQGLTEQRPHLGLWSCENYVTQMTLHGRQGVEPAKSQERGISVRAKRACEASRGGTSGVLLVAALRQAPELCVGAEVTGPRRRERRRCPRCSGRV